MGSGNFTNGDTGEVCTRQLAALTQLGAGRCRINLYAGAYLVDNDWNRPRPEVLDSVMEQMHAARITPMLLFEYYTHDGTEAKRLGDRAQWQAIGHAFAARFQPGGTWATERGITDGFGLDLYTASNEPEPGGFAAGKSPGPEPYLALLLGLADGVHAVGPALRVVPGGFMAANAWQDWSLRGLGTGLAPMLNDGTLAGLDLHTYADVQWAPMEGTYASSAQHNFDRVKMANGITREIEFFATEFNYKHRACPPEQAAAGLLTAIWDNLAVVGSDGRTLVTRLAMPWNLFNLATEDAEFGLATTMQPYVPSQRGEVVARVLTLTRGLTLVAADPRRTGMIALRGPNRTMWVWQNRPGWTDRPGPSVTLDGVPPGATAVTVHGWNGLRGTVPITPGQPVLIKGLATGETSMFVVEAADVTDPETLLPARATPRLTLADVAGR